MIILSVDYGDARTGIAVCDRMQLLASPVTVINQSYEPKVIAEIKELVKKHGAEKIVVGLPKNMNGTEGERAQKCKAFAQKLQEETGTETVMWDERLTTVSAHRALNVTNVTGKKRKGIVDAVSAVMILEDYLAAQK
ncbi:MAG: Holliday junction resolvase RuvX [Clostridia bacterium]|nr:Holliday junction resolvase RuvX [Clostridia bacterium]